MTILYPVPQANVDKAIEMDIYARFMRHLRLISHDQEEIKILTSIQFVSDMTASSEAHVSKVLVDYGLRAPRSAFPSDYLDYVDAAILKQRTVYGAPSDGKKNLVEYWKHIESPQRSQVRSSSERIEGEFYLGLSR